MFVIPTFGFCFWVPRNNLKRVSYPENLRIKKTLISIKNNIIKTFCVTDGGRCCALPTKPPPASRNLQIVS